MTMFNNIPSLSDCALLVELNIGTWTARKLDKKVTEETNQRKRAVRNASRTHKSLLPEAQSLIAVVKYAAACRNWLTLNTAPWSDNGARLVPSTSYSWIFGELNTRRTEFYRLVDVFVAEYTNLIAQQAFTLGDMFDRSEYPSEEDIRRKFYFNVTPSPVPAVGDFRVDIHREALNDMQGQYREALEARIEGVYDDLRTRLVEGLKHVSTNLEDKEDGGHKKFNSDMLERLVEKLSQIRELNIMKDETLNEVISHAKSAVAHVDIKDIRESKAVRHDVKARVDDILDKFAF